MDCPDCGKEMHEVRGFRPPIQHRHVMGDFCRPCLIYIEREHDDGRGKKVRLIKRPEV
jgi:hypothetical protein